MKKRTLTISLIVLAIMLLVGIGYAGWVISSTTSGEAAGNFTAYTVESANLTVSAYDGNVVFGQPANPAAPVWLEAQDVDTEDLVATFTLSWSSDVVTPVVLNLEHVFYTVVEGVDTPVSSANAANLAKLISGPSYNVSGANASISGSAITLGNGYQANTPITVTVTYQWGPSLGGSLHSNPYDFFNGKTMGATPDSSEQYNSESTYGALAQNALQALKDFQTNGLKMKVAVSKAA